MFFPPPSHDPEAGPSRSDLWRVANLLLDAGLTIDEVEQRVVERGVARPFARTLLGDVLAARQRAVDTNPAPRPGPARGWRAIGVGALWLLGGALVTTLSCVLVAPGGSYLVASGAMLYGAIQIARGAGQVMGPDRTPVMDPAARPRPTGDPAPAGPELVRAEHPPQPTADGLADEAASGLTRTIAALAVTLAILSAVVWVASSIWP